MIQREQADGGSSLTFQLKQGIGNDIIINNSWRLKQTTKHKIESLRRDFQLRNDKMNTYEGVVKQIIFHNSENDFTVLKLETSDAQISVAGFFPGVYSGFMLRVEGEYKTHPKYGESLSPFRWRAALPTQRVDIATFLYRLIIDDYWDRSVNEFDPLTADHIGEDMISVLYRIIDKYQDKVYEVIVNNTNELRSVHKSLESDGQFSIVPILLIETIEKVYSLHAVAAALAEIDMQLVQYTSKMVKIVNSRTQLYEAGDVLFYLQNHPYVFCDYLDGYGFDFPQADVIAKHYNLPMDSYERCYAGIKYGYKTRILSDGHVFATPRQLLSVALDILELEREKLIERILELISDGELIRDSFAGVEAIYLHNYYDMECYIAGKLTDMYRQNQGNTLIYPDYSEINRTIGLELDEYQQEAISTAINSPIAIITGGPGTGKTTIIRGIIAALKAIGITSINLAAPTGRAALRMKEATGIHAQTIHRLLNITPMSTREEVVSIESDVVIVDEVSMIDIDLMDKLVFALKPHVKLILVGDVDQLPSVGPGYILHDMIESEGFDVVRLTQTHRQAEDSSIIKNARRILRGEMIELDYRSLQTDFYFEQTDNRTQTEETIGHIYSTIYSALIEDDPGGVNDIQVLSPVIDGVAGTRSLNAMIQEMINYRDDTFETIDGEIFKSGDRIIVTRNDYDNNVFNGEISNHCAVVDDRESGRKKLRLTFDGGRQVEYEERGSNTRWLSLAYAITVHKSQGSEYPYVIMPVFKNGNLYRNLIYTAMTRAKGLLYMVGSLEDLEKGIAEVRPVLRNSKLKERIQQTGIQ